MTKNDLFPNLTKTNENKDEKDEKGIESETKPFNMSEIDFWNEKYFPSIFPRDKESITKFMAEDGIGLNSIEECSLIRIFQVNFL